MSNGHAGSAASHREDLSALVDGELTAAPAVTAACAAWKDDAAIRAAWHGYQLIGDVLRSEDLASQPARDAAFMQSLRERLAAEPVVLAPAAIEQQPVHRADDASARRPRRSWAMPAAVAAGFMAVAGALLATRTPTPVTDAVIAGDARPTPLSAGGPLSLASSVSTTPEAAAAAPVVVLDAAASGAGAFVTSNRILLRDPQLDRYLAAHKQFAGSTALGMPSAGFVRHASGEATGR